MQKEKVMYRNWEGQITCWENHFGVDLEDKLIGRSNRNQTDNSRKFPKSVCSYDLPQLFISDIR